MAQTRTTIELLSKILWENGTSKVKAEIFRLSKFNQNDAVWPLWRLLFEMIYYCEYGKIDDTSVRACGELSQAELVVYVKRELQKKGFFSKDFAVLPKDMSQGSRELLLAVGWLLCKENIITRFMKNCTSPLDDDTGSLHAMPQEAEQNKPTLDGGTTKPDPYHKIQQLLWLNNKLQLNLRSLFALQREKNILKHRIHEATFGLSGAPDRNHLSQMEVYMLRHPEFLKNNIELLERDNERLQNLLKWRDHEDVFWHWMGSVLDAKIKDQKSTPHDPAAGDSYATSTDLTTDQSGATRAALTSGAGDEALRREECAAFAWLRETHSSLRDAIVKYEDIVDHLETVWEDQSSEVTDAELDSVLSSIDLELSVQKANIALSNCRRYLQNQTPEKQQPATLANSVVIPSAQDLPSPRPREPQFILEKKSQQNNHTTSLVHNRLRATDSDSDFNPDLDSRDIELEIQSLNDIVNRMEREIEEKQNSFKEEMQSLSTKFQDAICIPPMARKF